MKEDPGQSGRRRIAENILNKSESELADGCRRYLQWLALKNYSPQTIKARYYLLNFFVYWAVKRGFSAYEQINCRAIKLYELSILEWARRAERPITVRYHYQCLQTVQSMFEYLVENAVLGQNPARDMELPKFQRARTGHTLTHEQIETVLQQPDVEKWVGLRDRAMFEVMYSTGIRRGELVGLRFADVDVHSGVLYVREGKGKKQRLVPIGARALVWLNKYLYEVRPWLSQKGESNALFLTYKGKGFTCSGLANIARRYMHAAGQKGCCHVFRHAMATAMLENGANISAIQDILGHEALSSTQVYTQVRTDKLCEVYAHTHPANTPEEKSGNESPQEPSCKPLYKWGGKPYTRKPCTDRQLVAKTALDEQLGRYLADMADHDMSPQTINRRRWHLVRFVAWCESRGIHEPGQVTHALLERYHKDLYRQRYHDKPLNPAYIGRHLISVRRFFAWLAGTEVIPHNVAAKIRLPRRMKTIPHQILTPEEIKKLFAQVDTTDILGLRDRAILELLWATGMRTGELCALRIEDVDLAQKTVRILQERGKSERIVPITPGAHKWLEIYLSQARPRLKREEDLDILFLSRYGPPLHSVTLRDNISRYFRAAGIKKPGNCRIFRHTLATAMLENGADIRYVQQILGHARLNSTQIYTKVSIRKLKEVHAQTHPASQVGRKSDTSESTSEDEHTI